MVIDLRNENTVSVQIEQADYDYRNSLLMNITLKNFYYGQQKAPILYQNTGLFLPHTKTNCLYDCFMLL